MSVPAMWTLGAYTVGGTLLALALGIRSLGRWWRRKSKNTYTAPPAPIHNHIQVAPVVSQQQPPNPNISGPGQASGGLACALNGSAGVDLMG